MAVELTIQRVSLEQYLEIDAASAEPLEYLDGYVVAQAVPSGSHEQITLNIALLCGPAVKAAGCRLLIGGVKVVCPNGDRAIPDFGITCDARDVAALDTSGEALVSHPWLVGEILSPTTAEADRGAKLDAYSAIPSLTHYLLIDSRRRWMLLHQRTVDGLFTINGPQERIVLPTIGELGVSAIYDQTAVPHIA